MRTLALLFLTLPASAQFQILPTPTTADLRGIHAVGPEIAWASGTNGTILRTTDAGAHWALCPTPPNAEHLDFRGIQAFDDKTAIVMSSGKGDLSRLYKTTDACAHWTLLFTNPDPEGFWDAFRANGFGNPKMPSDEVSLWAAGDPVDGRFTVFNFAKSKFYLDSDGPTQQFINTPFPPVYSNCKPPDWDGKGLQLPPAVCPLFHPESPSSIPAPSPGETIFAASNSAFLPLSHGDFMFITGGPSGARFLEYHYITGDTSFPAWIVASLPLAKGPTAGAFSIGMKDHQVTNVVGGDYLKPNETTGTAAFTTDNGEHWLPAQTPPHGYRSSVAYSHDTKTWITVGPNGTDISTDDGLNWRPLRPNPTAGDPPGADTNWNALALPYVVGPHGRIGKLRPQSLTAPPN